MKKFKILFALLAVFLLVFTTTVSASAAESPIENEIISDAQKTMTFENNTFFGYKNKNTFTNCIDKNTTWNS